ncbi:glycoside hydrolase family protein [Aureliella helgolandensis]|uniref:Glycosyl hydrolase family 32 N-terminal domain-containing protein n=1 Tax=Aureliella helgolandensis TaxID=2527968 RepID=A0A518GCV1_9BACT|nr:hypothetical protein [Aureliella helgolandensis]QDV26390.1 hypothetical protein Q31a_47640 [Aureliella helgolandensis]
MRYLLAILSLLASPLTLLCHTAIGADDEVVHIGNRRELLVDHHLIEELDHVRLVLNRPRDEGVALKFDNPWEGPFCGYCTVIKDGDQYRAYYRGRPEAGADGDPGEVYCCAESEDGIVWTKPELELFTVRGHSKNNIILAEAAPVTHNFSPMLDTRPGVPADERYKAIGGTMTSGLIAMISADGIHWKKLRDEPVIATTMVPYKYMFDSQNLAFWSTHENKYICYFRVFEDGIRRICRSTSDDFLQWSEPVLMEYRNPTSEPPIEQLYTNQTHPYFRAPHLYVSIAARFMPGRQVLTEAQANAIDVSPQYFRDTSDAILMTSRGGKFYDRTFLGGFVRPGIGARNWVSRTNYPALNIVQTGPTEMSVYLNQDYAQPTSHLRRYSMRLDGFASAQAPHSGGELLTKPLTFTGRELAINFGTSAAGGIRVEIQDPAGNPLPGFSLDEATEQIGNEIKRVVTWKSGSDVASLSGKPVRLRFVMKDADLYAFKFDD